MNHRHQILFVIFGISGDLAKRKLMPALYRLVQLSGAPTDFRIVGVTRSSDYTVDTLREGTTPHIGNPNESQLTALFDRVTILHNELKTEADYSNLHTDLEDQSRDIGNDVVRLYYLSIPPSAFPGVIQNLGQTGHGNPFANESERPRILVEKPFGFDTASAKTLIDATEAEFGENQIYRIDHYLAKETAQNIFAFRFKNALFESSWNSRHISRIRIISHETLDIEGRAAFYEQTGALRDIIQSHHMQLLALVMMERPESMESADIHASKLALLESIKPISKETVASRAVRAQYDGYRTAVGNKKSATETFARLTLESRVEQWRGTEIILETGKALNEKSTRIEVTFKPYDDTAEPNLLVFTIAPTEGIYLHLQAKRPGLTNHTQTALMQLEYIDPPTDPAAEAYERVIADAFSGDQTLFATSAEVMASWKIVNTVLQEWAANDDNLRTYSPGDDPQNIL